MTNDRMLVLYHGACRDGFCAAWVIWSKFPGAEFVAANYGDDPPDVKGRDVVIVDFSYSLGVMNMIAAEAASLLVLDHHKTAEEALRAFSAPNAEVHFDMNRSGAGMAWDHFYAGYPRPWLVDYVEDRDLWRFALPQSKAINAFIGTIPYAFSAWDHWGQGGTLSLPEAIAGGLAVEAKVEQYVAAVSGNARRISFAGYSDIPCVNAPCVDISELVGKLAEGVPFAIGWWQRADGSYSYGLRSRGDVDVGEIAKKYGGGGHRQSAGFQSSFHPDALPQVA